MPSIVSTDRKIEYYKVAADGGDNGLFGVKLKEIMMNVDPVAREYKYHDTSVNLYLLPDKDSDSYIRGIVQQIRFVAPSKREAGNVISTQIDLEESEGIDEKTHFMYCPESSLLCIEYNFHGPKIGLLVNVVNGIYREQVEKKEKRSSYKFIQKGNAVNKVIESAEIRTITAKPVDPSTAGMMNEETDLPDALREFEAPEDTKLEFRLSPKIRGNRIMSGESFKRRFLRNLDDLEYYDKLMVDAVDDATGKVVVYDLIKDKLNERFTVDFLPGTKTINSDHLIEIMEGRVEAVKAEYLFS